MNPNTSYLAVFIAGMLAGVLLLAVLLDSRAPANASPVCVKP